MEDNPYAIARLSEEQVDELKQLERQLSEQNGQAVTLIAYQADES